MKKKARKEQKKRALKKKKDTNDINLDTKSLPLANDIIRPEKSTRKVALARSSCFCVHSAELIPFKINFY